MKFILQFLNCWIEVITKTMLLKGESTTVNFTFEITYEMYFVEPYSRKVSVMKNSEKVLEMNKKVGNKLSFGNIDLGQKCKIKQKF